MPKTTTAANGTFKAWFNAAKYHQIADELAEASPDFNRQTFLHLTLEGLASRELMDRMRQTAIAAQASLPGTYAQQLEVLLRAARPQENGFVGVWYAEFVGHFGLDDPARSLPALAYFTRFGSAEFAIRSFLQADPAATLQVMMQWVRSADEHVRRLASEGSRPRLPWGQRLEFLIKDPAPTRPILETLKNDPSLYVRKSVANHLNDIAKDHPVYVLDLVGSWDRSSPRTAWIGRHGLRTLIKQGHSRALTWMGAGASAELSAVRFRITPRQLNLGKSITMHLDLSSSSSHAQTLLIDYLVHYVKASGKTQPKVFKWKQLILEAGATIKLSKKQTIRDFSTRKHYPGNHRVEIQINGQVRTQHTFVLR